MSVTPKNLEGLTWDQLRKLEHAVIEAQAREYQKLKAEMTEMATDFAAKANSFAAKHGVKTADIPAVVLQPASNGNGQHKAVKAKGRKATKIAIKFRNPQNPAETWSGRGRPARWLAALEAQGRKRAEFAVGR